MLLQGSYLKDIDKIMDALKVTRRKLLKDEKIKV